MALVTTRELLDEIATACENSDLVETYVVQHMDIDILKVRVYLTNARFIEVFYNIMTEKVAFALIEGEERTYGKDNAKMGWHVHPWENPREHVPCEPVTFAEFLQEVEKLVQN